MAVLNNGLAGALGRPDLVPFVRSQGTVYGGPSPTVVAGSSQSLLSGGDAMAGGIVGSGGGRGALLLLMALVGAYAAFTWWVRPHLA